MLLAAYGQRRVLMGEGIWMLTGSLGIKHQRHLQQFHNCTHLEFVAMPTLRIFQEMSTENRFPLWYRIASLNEWERFWKNTLSSQIATVLMNNCVKAYGISKFIFKNDGAQLGSNVLSSICLHSRTKVLTSTEPHRTQNSKRKYKTICWQLDFLTL